MFDVAIQGHSGGKAGCGLHILALGNLIAYVNVVSDIRTGDQLAYRFMGSIHSCRYIT